MSCRAEGEPVFQAGVTVCDGCDGVLGDGGGIEITVTIDTHRHGQNWSGAWKDFSIDSHVHPRWKCI